MQEFRSNYFGALVSIPYASCPASSSVLAPFFPLRAQPSRWARRGPMMTRNTSTVEIECTIVCQIMAVLHV